MVDAGVLIKSVLAIRGLESSWARDTMKSGLREIGSNVVTFLIFDWNFLKSGHYFR